jgi:CBS domain-containing protein
VDCDKDKVGRERAGELLVCDVMLAHPKTLPGDATLGDVRRLFANPHVATALLLDGDAFAGAIERGRIPATLRDDVLARSVAARVVDTIGPLAPVASALARLDAAHEHRLVVLDDDGVTLRGLLCLNGERTGFCQDTPAA